MRLKQGGRGSNPPLDEASRRPGPNGYPASSTEEVKGGLGIILFMYHMMAKVMQPTLTLD